MSTIPLLRCFECLQVMPVPDDLFKHLKNVHGICGNSDFKCSLCLADFELFGSFKIHINSCCLKKGKEAEQAQHTAQTNEAFDLHHDLRMEYSDEVSDFKEHVQKLALELAVHLSANMSIPRSLVFETLAEFQMFYSKTFIHGLFTCFLRTVRSLRFTFLFTYLMQALKR